jgi:hypothetical protein
MTVIGSSEVYIRKGCAWMGILGYLIILAFFLSISWFVRYVVSQDVARRVNRKEAEHSVGFCTWPREMAD